MAPPELIPIPKPKPIAKTSKTEVTLFRHVKVTGADALYGQTDVKANIDKNNQAFYAFAGTSFAGNSFESDKEHLSQRFDFILTSPLQRCKLLAKRLSENSNIPCIELPGFQEMNFGDYDGLAFERFADVFNGSKGKNESQNQNNEQNWQVLEKFWQDPANNTLPNAESLLAFKQRIDNSWQQLLTQYQGKRILLVTHGGVIRMILAHILPLDWQNPSLYQSLKIGNASLTKINSHQYFCDQHIENVHCEVEYIGLPLL